MLSMHLGEALFLEGVSQYLKAHAFANAETTDLWRALADVSGEDISTMMSTWTTNVGYPILTVTELEIDGIIHIEQNRYLRSGPPKPEEDKVIWPVFLNIRTNENDHDPALFNSRTTEIKLPASDFYKLNTEHTGVYRVLYPPSRVAKLAEAARAGKLSAADRSGLLFDAVSLTQSGHQSLTVTFDLAQALSEDSSSFVWQAQTKWYDALQAAFVFSDARLRAGIIKAQRKVYSHKSQKFRPGVGQVNGVVDAQFKENIFTQAGLSGDKATIESAERMFYDFADGYSRDAIPLDLRAAVFKVILSQQHDHSMYDYDVVTVEFEVVATTAGERAIAASALGYSRLPAAIRRSIAVILEPGKTNLGEIINVLLGLTTHVEGNMALLDSILTNFDAWKNRFGVGLGGLAFVLPVLLGGFATFEHADQLEAFLKKQDMRGNERELAQALEEIRIKAAWAARDGSALMSWLESHGFA